jgi:stage II sporulation protein P
VNPILAVVSWWLSLELMGWAAWPLAARLFRSTASRGTAFAKHLGARLNAVAPGLCRGVRILDGRYNQDLSPLALIVEVGGAQSTMEECLVSARILAGAVSDLLGGP